MLGKALLGIGVAVVLVAAGLAWAIHLNRVPLTDPPGFFTRLLTYLGRNEVRTSRHDLFPERRSMRLTAPAPEFYERARPLIEGLGWRPGAASESGMDFVVSSPLLGFRDDVRLTIERDAAGQDWLEVRATSRLGRGDLGANTRHLMRLREVLTSAGLVEAAGR